MKEYKIKKSLEKALKLLKRITQIWVSDEGVIQVNIVAKNPNLAAQIANTYLTTVDKFLKESNMSRGHNMRVFIEKRLATAESDLKQASDSLKVFQERNKVISLDDETKAVIDAYAQLKSELLKREIELGVNENTSTQDNPYVLSIKREIEEFKNKLQNIETGKKTEEGFGVGFAVPFKNLPALAAEYAQRLGDFKVQEQIYALLIQQYEQAKVLEARDTPNITILDYAKVPEKKDSPKKIKIVLNVFILTLLLSI
jgi:capsule polysaccharide export protein KpsE/RkpR